MNNKVLIIPYFGVLPNYIDLFLKGCKLNINFADFLFVTDTNVPDYLPSNVTWLNMSFNDFNNLVKKKLNIKVNVYTPYKICDYRPALGKIFEDLIKKYEFFGYCDIDLILGNLSKFISKDAFIKYDKLLIQGHLSFYRNNNQIKNIYRYGTKTSVSFNDVIKYKEPCYFDEIFFDRICEESGIKQYKNFSCADILPQHLSLTIAPICSFKNMKDQIFYFNGNGIFRDYIKNGVKKTDQFMYIHLQKRKMKKLYSSKDEIIYINADNFSAEKEDTKHNIIKRIIYNIKYRIKRLRSINKNKIRIKIAICFRRNKI
jgi:hypothetical protein